MKAKLAVFVSGNGTNLQAILDACDSGELDAVVTVVVSNKKNAYSLVRAEIAGKSAISARTKAKALFLLLTTTVTTASSSPESQASKMAFKFRNRRAACRERV